MSEDDSAGQEREREVVGGFSLALKGRIHTPQAAAVIGDDGKTVTIHIMSTPFLYYFIPGVLGAIGMAVANIPALLAGVVVGTAITFYAQRRKYAREIEKLRTGELDVSNDIIVKKGKIKKIEGDENRFGEALDIVTPSEEFRLTGETEDIKRLKEVLL
ncbi:MAG: hypothetical protein SXQ77_10505 [Halobacteria archaeon]|nr:hypothetical protein [Halobacteria archaeon]